MKLDEILNGGIAAWEQVGCIMVSFRMFPWLRRHYLNNSLFRQRISFSLPFIVAWVLTQHTSKLGIDIYLVNG